MLRHPALVLAEIGSDAERKALFAEQNVAAVAGVDGHDRVVLREVADIALAFVDIRLGVQSLDEVAVPQRIQDVLSHAGHDRHIQNDVNGIGQLDADLGKGRTDRPHGVGNDVHGSPLHRAAVEIFQHRVGFVRIHPVVDGAGRIPVFRADKRAVLHARDVVDRRAVQITSGEKFLVQFDEFARGDGFRAQRVQLRLAPVDPDDLVRLTEIFAFFHKSEYLFVACHKTVLLIYFPPSSRPRGIFAFFTAANKSLPPVFRTENRKIRQSKRSESKKFIFCLII